MENVKILLTPSIINKLYIPLSIVILLTIVMIGTIVILVKKSIKGEIK